MTVKIEDGTLTYDQYVKQGSMMILRECLEYDDPDQLYNYLKRNGVLCPEDYGIEHPLTFEFKDRDRASLIDEILGLRKTLHHAALNGFI